LLPLSMLYLSLCDPPPRRCFFLNFATVLSITCVCHSPPIILDGGFPWSESCPATTNVLPPLVLTFVLVPIFILRYPAEPPYGSGSAKVGRFGILKVVERSKGTATRLPRSPISRKRHLKSLPGKVPPPLLNYAFGHPLPPGSTYPAQYQSDFFFLSFLRAPAFFLCTLSSCGCAETCSTRISECFPSLPAVAVFRSVLPRLLQDRPVAPRRFWSPEIGGTSNTTALFLYPKALQFPPRCLGDPAFFKPPYAVFFRYFLRMHLTKAARDALLSPADVFLKINWSGSRVFFFSVTGKSPSHYQHLFFF